MKSEQQEETELIKKLPEDKLTGWFADSGQKKEAFSKLESLKKKEIITDYDTELASHRNAKYNDKDWYNIIYSNSNILS